MVSESAGGERRSFWKEFLIMMVVLVAIMLFVFRKGLEPEQVLFANDGPLGVLMSQADQAKQAFTGYWAPNNWLGIEQPSALPTFTMSLFLLLGDPVTFAKWYAPLSLLFAGVCAWYCFRKFGFHQAVCVLGGIAAMLNMNSFSNAAWGLPIRAITLGVAFLAVAALHGTLRGWWPLKAMLAGACVALAVMEGFDVGALFSLWLGAFAFFVGYLSQGTRGARIMRGAMQLGIVALFAVVVAAAALQTLIGTQIVGVAAMQQDPASKAKRWSEATQWSLPKMETLRVIIPGLFGYRMDTPKGGNYWGAVGRPEGAKQGQHSGSGEYAGLLVVIGAIWGIAQARRKKDSGYDDLQRCYIWFWAALALLALVFAWGYHAPFYKIIYSLPYFSTIRNPIKFMHLFHFCALILFGFGLDNLVRRYCVTPAGAKTLSVGEQFAAWKRSMTGFEKIWVYGSLCAVGVAFLSAMAFSASRASVLRYLGSTGYGGAVGEQITKFAQGELLVFALFLSASVGIILLIVSRVLSGQRAKIGFVLLGVILFADLLHANKPWIVYYDHTYKYESNPLIDLLKDKPYERRVTGRFLPHGNAIATDNSDFMYVYFEWLQNQFQSLNIHSLDIIQMPRMPAMDQNFLGAFVPRNTPPLTEDLQRLPRLWELSNTRFLLGQRTTESTLRGVMVTNGSITIAQAFNLAMKPKVDPDHRIPTDNVTVQFATNGQFAVFEYKDALPRTALYSYWETPVSTEKVTAEEAALGMLSDGAFDPHQSVLITGEAPKPTVTAPAPKDAAKIVSYRPRQVEIEAEAKQPSVLLLNDRYHPHWKVFVDGKQEPLLRCNYIMRGVHLPPGKHTVRFQFEPPTRALSVSLAGLAITLAICLFLAIRGSKTTQAAPV